MLMFQLLSQREETIKVLNFQRSTLQEDKHMLNEEERVSFSCIFFKRTTLNFGSIIFSFQEHSRIARIGQRTDDIEQEVRS